MMGLDQFIEEQARARRKRVGLLSVMLLGDFIFALALALWYMELVVWPIAAALVVVGLSVSIRAFWLVFSPSWKTARKSP